MDRYTLIISKLEYGVRLTVDEIVYLFAYGQSILEAIESVMEGEHEDYQMAV